MLDIQHQLLTEEGHREDMAGLAADLFAAFKHSPNKGSEKLNEILSTAMSSIDMGDSEERRGEVSAEIFVDEATTIAAHVLARVAAKAGDGYENFTIELNGKTPGPGKRTPIKATFSNDQLILEISPISLGGWKIDSRYSVELELKFNTAGGSIALKEIAISPDKEGLPKKRFKVEGGKIRNIPFEQHDHKFRGRAKLNEREETPALLKSLELAAYGIDNYMSLLELIQTLMNELTVDVERSIDILKRIDPSFVERSVDLPKSSSFRRIGPDSASQSIAALREGIKTKLMLDERIEELVVGFARDGKRLACAGTSGTPTWNPATEGKPSVDELYDDATEQQLPEEPKQRCSTEIYHGLLIKFFQVKERVWSLLKTKEELLEGGEYVFQGQLRRDPSMDIPYRMEYGAYVSEIGDLGFVNMQRVYERKGGGTLRTKITHFKFTDDDPYPLEMVTDQYPNRRDDLDVPLSSWSICTLMRQIGEEGWRHINEARDAAEALDRTWAMMPGLDFEQMDINDHVINGGYINPNRLIAMITMLEVLEEELLLDEVSSSFPTSFIEA